jgi:hypothetical protein
MAPGVPVSLGMTLAMAMSPILVDTMAMFPRAAYCGSSKISSMAETGPHGTWASAHVPSTSATYGSVGMPGMLGGPSAIDPLSPFGPIAGVSENGH